MIKHSLKMRKKSTRSTSASQKTQILIPQPQPPPPVSHPQTQIIHTVSYAEPDATTITYIQTNPHSPENESNTPSEFLCFICNSSYYTFISGESKETNRNQVSVLCQAFGVPSSEEETLGTLISSLKEPFCESCLAMVKQLEEDIVTVNLLNKRIDQFKIHIAKTLSTNFPQSPIDLAGAYWVKVKMIQNSEALLHGAQDGLEQELQLYSSQPLQIDEESEGHTQEVVQNEEMEGSGETGYESTGPEADPVPDTNPEPEPGPAQMTDRDRSAMTLGTLLDLPVKVIPRPPNRRITKPSPNPNKPKIVTNRDYSAGMPEAYAELGTKSTADLDDTGICRICQNQFPTKIALWKHLKRQHSGATFKCHHCDKTFRDVSNRNRHEKAVHLASSRDFICDTCGKGFKTKEMLYAHNKYTHQGYRQKQRIHNPSLCPHCGKVLTCQKNLVLHIRTMHGINGDGKFPLKHCPICEKPFKVGRNIRPHIRTHMAPWELIAMGGEGFHYKCFKCPKDNTESQIGFNSKTALISHYETEHPNELRPNVKTIKCKPAKKKKPFECLECEAQPAYTTLQGLQHHVDSGHKIHGAKIYYCRYCDKICIGVGRLKQHEKTHPDIKPNKRNLTNKKKPRGASKNYKFRQLLELYNIKECQVKVVKLEQIDKVIKIDLDDHTNNLTIDLDASVQDYVLPTLVIKDEV